MRTIDCDACGAHFALPEELYQRKVAGRKTAVRCKVCGARVRLDGTRQPDPPWVVAVADEDREMSTAEVVAAIAAGTVRADTLLWQEGMADWVLAAEHEELAPLFAGAEPDLDAAPESVDLEELELETPRARAQPPPKRPLVRPAAGAPPVLPGAEETAPAAPVAQRARDAELHALFAVESVPPPVELADTELVSLPPSEGPPPGASPYLFTVPKAPRRPSPDALAMDGPGGVLLAPPNLGALAGLADLPAGEPDAAGTLDIPIEEELTAPEPFVARRANVAAALALEPAPAPTARGAAGRWGLLVAAAVVLLGGAALLLWSRAAPPPLGDGASVAQSSTPPALDPAPVERPGSGSDGATPGPAPEGTEPVAVTAPGTGHLSLSTPAPAGAAADAADAAVPTTKPSTTAPAPADTPSAPTTPPAAAGQAFDKAAASTALTAAAAAASGCRRGADPSGTATVVITFAPSGRVTSANLSGPPFAGTATGGCIAAAMRAARVAPFTGSHVTVSKRVVIQ